MADRMRQYLLLSSALAPLIVATPALAQSAGVAVSTAVGQTGDDAKTTTQRAPALTTATQSATGAEADPQAGQTIVITGIRHSLNVARDIKRDSTQFVDAIVADDIGKLPDRNVAESLARVSGVQVDRGIGEGTSVSIRGLRQNVFLLNGREIDDATGRGGNGLETLNTSTYGILALVPSELIARLDVTKLAGADQVSGALGGIVDIQTRMPLEGPNQVAAKISGIYADQSRRHGFESFGLVSQKFAHDTLGILLSASYNKRPVSQKGIDTFSGYLRFTDPSGTVRFGNSDVRPETISETRKDLGLDGVIQWEPTPGVELTADSFYSRLNSDRSRWWLSFTPTSGLSNAQYSPDNILLSGTATGPVLTNTEFLTTMADIWSSALRGKLDVTTRLKATAEVSYDRSSSTAHQIYFRMQPIASITPTVDFDFTQGDFGSYQIHGIDLTDPSQLRFTILFDNDFRATTKDVAARNDWTYSFGEGFLRSLDAGVRYQHLNTIENPLRADIRPSGGIPATQMAQYLELHADTQTADLGLPPTYLVANDTVRSCSVFTDFPSISQNVQCLDPTDNTNALSSTFTIKEGFTDGYAKVDFDSDLGAARLTGNIGIRYIHRRLTSIGNLIDAAGAATPATFRRSDDEWLPSGVAKLAVTNDLIFRLGAAKVVAFPNTADLNNGVTLANNAVFVNGVQTVLGTGTGGAPNLDPFKATQADFSAEYYFGKEGLVSAGLFYKDVSTFIVQQQSAESYGGVNYLINRKVNGGGAKVKGVELLAQLPFYFLPSPLDGFGIVATYSYISSSTPTKDVAGRTLPFPGLSKNNVNFIGYYEKGPLSVRVAYNWRDDYLLALSAAATGIYNSPYSDLSTTIRYDVNKHFSLGFEASNLLDEKQRTYDGVSEALRTNVYFGRLYKASVSVKF